MRSARRIATADGRPLTSGLLSTRWVSTWGWPEENQDPPVVDAESGGSEEPYESTPGSRFHVHLRQRSAQREPVRSYTRARQGLDLHFDSGKPPVRASPTQSRRLGTSAGRGSGSSPATRSKKQPRPTPRRSLNGPTVRCRSYVGALPGPTTTVQPLQPAPGGTPGQIGRLRAPGARAGRRAGIPLFYTSRTMLRRDRHRVAVVAWDSGVVSHPRHATIVMDPAPLHRGGSR
jgi:hypothetical protein